MLFAHLPSPALAGNMAARLFSVQSWIGVVSGALLLLLLRRKQTPPIDSKALGALFWIALAMLSALLLELAVAPHIVARDNLRYWHSVGTALYVLQWVCASRVLWFSVRGLMPRAVV